MDAGNRAREISDRNDILALHAASAIHSRRADEQPLPETVHIILSLKHPHEVTALRRIYGAGSFLIGLYTPRAERQLNLETLDMSTRQASQLMKRDENEEIEIGQQTSATFHQADVFLSLDSAAVATFDSEVERFVDLLFGDPFRTPTAAEHAMFLAFAGSLRSASASEGRLGVQKAPWDRKTTIPRVPMTADSYIEREMVANLTIRETIRKGKANETRKTQRIRR